MEKDTNADWFVEFGKCANPKLNLYCFPPLGCDISLFVKWPKLLPASVQVIGVCLPQRAHRSAEPGFTDTKQMIDEVVSVISSHAKRPFALFGMSMGATPLVVESARALQQGETGHLLKHAFVAAALPPHVHGPFWSDELRNPSVRGNKRSERSDLGLVEEVLTWDGLSARLKKLGIQQLSKLLPLPRIRNDFATVESYTYSLEEPEVKLNCPLTALGGDSDWAVSPDQLKEWEQWTNSEFDHMVFQGSHFFLANDARTVFDAAAPMQFISEKLEDTVQRL